MTDNEKHYCVCMTPDALSAEAQKAMAGRKAALLNEARWPTASKIRVKFVGGDVGLQNRVKEVARRWTAPGLANLTLSFVPPTEDADIRVAFVEGNGSWSFLGTMCKQIPKAQPTMNFGWLTPESTDREVQSVVLHEFGHALGLIHEHQNPEKAIQWNEAAVLSELAGPPNNWSEQKARDNVLKRYSKEEVTTTPVDGKSIMMYPIPKSWTLDGFSSGFNEELSDHDKTFIKKSYP